MNDFLWGVYPYLCIALFFTMPVLRLVYRPFSFSTRASGMFRRGTLGVASLALHWGLVLVVVGHLAGLFGGVLGLPVWIDAFYWLGLSGGLLALFGSILALIRRIVVPEVRAMSQPDDYVVHLFLIPILSIALYQVLVDRIFGVAYPAASWFASLWRLAPAPELMASASTLSKWHVFLALTFFAYFPFTKLVHLWSYPINYLVRPYQSVRTLRKRFQRDWEFAMRSDQSWMLLGMVSFVAVFVWAAALLDDAEAGGSLEASIAAVPSGEAEELAGYPLYVSQCARCHGINGEGEGPGAGSPKFAQPPRDLTAGQYVFVSTTNGVASDADLARTIREGLEPAGMPAFDRLSDAQVASLVTVLDGMWRDRPEPGPRIEVPPKPDGASAERGRELYMSLCATCHGESGRGDGLAGRGLPVPPANLAAGESKAGVEPEELYWRIAAGMLPSAMPPLGVSLTVEERWSLIEYLRSEILPGPPS